MRIDRPVALAVLLSAAACAHQGPKTMDVAWPPPPETPRVKYVRSIRSSTDMQDSAWDNFARTVLGAGKNVIQITRPQGLAVSPDGQRLYISDNLAGILRADFVKKSLEIFVKEEPVPDPFGIAVDAEENVYVTSSATKRVFVFDREGKKIRVIGGGLERPTGIAIDRKRQVLYVADTGGRTSPNHSVAAFSLTGERLRTIGTRGYGPGELNFPVHLAVDAGGNLFVGDTLNFRVDVFDVDGNFLRSFGEQGDSPGTFSRLKGIALDRFGNVYVADSDHSAVQIFGPEFDYLMYFGSHFARLEYMELPNPVVIDPTSDLLYVGEIGATPRINVYRLVNVEPGVKSSATERHDSGGGTRSTLGDTPQTSRPVR